MSFNILISDGLAQAGIDLLKAAGQVTVDPKITPDALLAALPEYDALIVRSRTKVNTQVVSAGRRLKVIGRAGVGVDNIDIAAALAAGVIVVNSPLAATVAVAELTLGLMLDLARRVPAADAALKRGKWEKSAFMGDELSGKTLGLIGFGRIGAEVARRARAFDMNIVAHDPYLSDGQIRDRGAEPASLETLLNWSDYVSMHLPLTEGTRNLFDTARLGQMRKGARLLCLARGGVIDEPALAAALDSGHLAGAALDVFATEPPGPGSIAEHPRVIGTPHIGAQTREAQDRAGLAIAEEVLAVLQGREPRFRVLAND
ncbi:MAG TPA: hydroxyacid dehydrogenase [Anaerolineales bacterium]|nr:hydroxyacid dehydrogenase [Anaerolineales bacterium]